MFNLVKWAFKLGQQTERQRIASILAEERANLPYYEIGVGNGPEREKAINSVSHNVSRIIDRIIQPTEKATECFSLLYPKDGK